MHSTLRPCCVPMSALLLRAKYAFKTFTRAQRLFLLLFYFSRSTFRYAIAIDASCLPPISSLLPCVLLCLPLSRKFIPDLLRLTHSRQLAHSKQWQRVWSAWYAYNTQHTHTHKPARASNAGPRIYLKQKRRKKRKKRKKNAWSWK